MFGGNAFGWPYFGEIYAGSISGGGGGGGGAIGSSGSEHAVRATEIYYYS